MADGVVTDPGKLKELATALFQLRSKYDAVTVTAQYDNEALGSWDVESGV
jgi:hypothetical protein